MYPGNPVSQSVTRLWVLRSAALKRVPKEEINSAPPTQYFSLPPCRHHRASTVPRATDAQAIFPPDLPHALRHVPSIIPETQPLHGLLHPAGYGRRAGR